MREFILSHSAFCLLFFIMLSMSLILFFAMGADKRRAKRGMYRIPDMRLFMLALSGGGTGGLAGMYCFRHKTKHLKFVIIFPLLAAAQLLGLICLLFI